MQLKATSCSCGFCWWNASAFRGLKYQRGTEELDGMMEEKILKIINYYNIYNNIYNNNNNNNNK